VESDCVLGHEAAGIVLKVGEGVTDLVVGKSTFFVFVSLIFFVSLPFSSGEGLSLKCCACVLEKSDMNKKQRVRKSRTEQSHGIRED